MEELDKLVPQYGKHKDESGELKKLCDLENAQIKEIMSNEKLKKHSAGGYTVTYIESNKTTVNEEKLLALLKSKLSKKQLKDLKLIKTVEQVDENALENAIYNSLIPEELVTEMSNCEEKSVITSIRITKNKEK